MAKQAMGIKQSPKYGKNCKVCLRTKFEIYGYGTKEICPVCAAKQVK